MQKQSVWSCSVPPSLFSICEHLSLISEGSGATVARPCPLLCLPLVRCGRLSSVWYQIYVSKTHVHFFTQIKHSKIGYFCILIWSKNICVQFWVSADMVCLYCLYCWCPYTVHSHCLHSNLWKWIHLLNYISSYFQAIFISGKGTDDR